MSKAADNDWLSLTFWPKLLFIILFALIAATINYYRLPLFFGIEFVFGSSVAILALMLLGGKAALFIGCAAAATTLLIWGHPYAWLVFTLEIAWLTWRIQSSKNYNLVLLDLQFWLLIGLPATILLYAIALDSGWNTAALVGLKQMSNGVFNTIVASVVLLLLQLHTGISQRLNLPLVQLRQLIFHVIMTLTLLAGSVPLLLNTHNLQQEYQEVVARQLQQIAMQIQKQLQLRTANLNMSLNQMPLNDMLQALLPADDLGVVLLNERKQILTSIGLIESFSAASGVMPSVGFTHLLPAENGFRLQRWRQSRYIYLHQVPVVDGVTFIGLEQPATEVLIKLERDSSRKLLLFFCFILLATVVSAILSKAISGPLRRLDNASKAIKRNVSAGRSTSMPTSNVAEYHSISQTLMAMSGELTTAFQLSQANQSELGRQVIERKAQLQQSNSQLEAILAAASDFSIIATKPDGIITFFSRGAEKLTGYQAKELIGQQTAAVLHLPAEMAQRAEQLTAELAQPVGGFDIFVIIALQLGSETRQWRYVRKDGDHVPVSLTVTPILDSNGIVSGYLGIAKDISELQRAETLKNEFISVVSHELRTPLTSIYAALRIMNSGKLGKVPDKVSDLLLVAESNSQRLTRLINDLLDIEKLDADKFPLELAVQPIMPLVSLALDNIASYAEQYQVTLVTDILPEPLMARVDGSRFMQIVTNLLSNAIKFSAKGGVVQVKLYAKNSAVKLEISDQGMGITDSFKPRIFEKFAQSDVANTRQQGGTGLGLAISKQLTEKMQGQIGFASKVGQGAIFWVSFQQVREEATMPNPSVTSEL
jgi:PAS domain S-box-containing protein